MKTGIMDSQIYHNSFMGAVTSLLSLGSASFSVITFKDVQPMVTLIGSLIAIASGIFAIRYYHFATKKLKSK
jgi:hypothetical protein